MQLQAYLALPLFPAKSAVRGLTCIHVHRNLSRNPASIEADGVHYRIAKCLWHIAAEACSALDRREREPPCDGPLGKLLRCLAAGGDTVSVSSDPIQEPPSDDEEPARKLADRIAASALARLQSEVARSVTRLYQERKDTLVEEALAALE